MCFLKTQNPKSAIYNLQSKICNQKSANPNSKFQIPKSKMNSHTTNKGLTIRENGILGFIFFVGSLVLLFFIARGIFKILTIASPALIIMALLINYRTVLGYLRFMINLLRRNPFGGIIAIILSIIGFPIL